MSIKKSCLVAHYLCLVAWCACSTSFLTSGWTEFVVISIITLGAIVSVRDIGQAKFKGDK